MDEARRMLERLQRIEALREGDAPPSRLLEELRALLAEGEAWLAAERAEGSTPSCDPTNALLTLRSGRALSALGEALDRGQAASSPASTGSEANAAAPDDPLDRREEVVSERLAV
jgi:hypothetical protein